MTFLVFFLFTATILVRRDFFFGGYYCLLFVYVFFALYGYTFYPEESESILAYFGPEIIPSLFWFLGASFMAFFALIWVTRGLWGRPGRYTIKVGRPRSEVFLALIFVHFLFMFSYWWAEYHVLTYENLGDELFNSDRGWVHFSFTYQYKLMPLTNLLIYFTARLKIPKNHIVGKWTLWAAHLCLFIVISARIGNRTDPLAWIFGLTALEATLGTVQRIPWMKISKVLAVLIVMAVVISWLPQTRELELFDSTFSIERRLIRQDYFAPAHMLFAAVAFDFVEPLEVLTSNFLNALVLMRHPYLQATITDLFNPGVTTRSASYAFYLFTEGFVFCGMWGWIYNAVIGWAGGVAFRMIPNSTNAIFNAFCYAMICTQFANMARCQSSYFLKDLYIIFLPVLLLFWLATGLRPHLFGRRRSSNSKYKNRYDQT